MYTSRRSAEPYELRSRRKFSPLGPEKGRVQQNFRPISGGGKESRVVASIKINIRATQEMHYPRRNIKITVSDHGEKTLTPKA